MKMPLPGAAAHAAHADHPGRGIAFALIGVFVFATQDAIAKWLVADYPVMEILFFRGLFALIPAAIIVHRTGGMATLRTKRLPLHLGRAALMFAALVCFYLAIRTMPLADAIAISFSAPLFMAALSMPLLGERVGPRRWAAVVIGFIGVLVAARPGAGMFDTAALLVVGASLCYALTMIATRRLTRSETAGAVMIYFNLASLALAGVFMPLQWVTPEPADAVLLCAIGLIGGVGAYFTVQSLRLAPVAVIAPFDYSSLLWATLYGYLLWSDLPGAAVLTGAAIIIGSNLYILHRETRAARREESDAATP